MSAFGFVAIIVLIALGFDFVNGFHDAANSIATVVATRVLRPFTAVLWASFFNFIAFTVFGLHVAATISSGQTGRGRFTPWRGPAYLRPTAHGASPLSGRRHPDAGIYLSEPGIGDITGARILGEYGDAPGRYAPA